MQKLIDISGFEKEAVLAALYNEARPQNIGFLRYNPAPMTLSEARDELSMGATYFDYLYGRVMKVDISGNTLDPSMYDRDNGENAAENALIKHLT